MLSEENNSKEQKNAELKVESFRRNLGPLVIAAETTRMAIFSRTQRRPTTRSFLPMKAFCP